MLKWPSQSAISSKKVSPAPKDLGAEGGRLESSGGVTANFVDTRLLGKRDPQLENYLYRSVDLRHVCGVFSSLLIEVGRLGPLWAVVGLSGVKRF